MRCDAAATDEFFVGYMPGMPRGIRARVLAALAGVFVAGGAIALLGAAMQRDPGRGLWAEDRSSITGVFRALPYPHLVVGAGAEQRSVLLFCEGKRAPGAQTWCGPIPDGLTAPGRPIGATFVPIDIDGRVVTATGRVLRRLDAPPGSVTALELGSERADLRVDAAAVQPAAAASPTQRVTLEGEIVDPKCYLGAMKPGNGRVHRACAWLCIKGGIAPVLVVSSSAGPRCIVLADSGGGAAGAQLAEFAGDRVRIEGELSTQHGLEVLRLGSRSPVRTP